jgi:membrane-bound lytic murein transglycosylase D
VNSKLHPAAIALFLLLLLVSCGPKQPPPAQIPAPPPAPPEPEPAPVVVEEIIPDSSHLYERLERSRQAYEEGVELLGTGEETAGEAKIAEAASDIRADAEECARTNGCDVSVFFVTYEHLLSLQSVQIKRQATDLSTLENSMLVEPEREPGTSPFASTLPEIDKTVSLLRGTDLRELINLNGPVSAAIDDWLTWLRPMLMDSYVNYMYLRKQIAPIYEEAGLPEALLFAMIATETGGKVHSYSRAGAAGLLQFMSYTGRKYGLRVVDDFDMRLDPVAATRANVAYLNDLFADLNDSLEKAIAAYNGGDGRLRRLNKRFNGASIWDSRFYYSLPRETREYVPRVLAAAWLFLHPEDYNLQWPELDLDTIELVLRQEIAIGELTICLGQEQNPDGWFRTIRNLNPELDPGERMKAGQKISFPAMLVPLYEERCLEGEILDRARHLHDENYPEEPEMIVYQVRRGDTLGKIASRFRCVSVGELAAINNIRAPRYVIRTGQRLKIPQCR